MVASNNLLHALLPWEPSLALLLTVGAAAVFYINGCALLKPPLERRFYFWGGLLSLYAVSHTGFDYYSEHAFFMHRIQHSILHHIGPFLIALARPGATLSAGLPVSWQARLRKMLESEFLHKTAAILNHPVVAVTLFCLPILFWLISPLHFIAMLDWRLYRIMNWTMALSGLMFWNLALNNYNLVPANLSPSCRIGMMLAVIPPQIIMGVLIFLAPHELYPIYTVCGRAFAVSAMTDQQLGGLILWIPAAMMSVLGILIVIRREWMTDRH